MNCLTVPFLRDTTEFSTFHFNGIRIDISRQRLNECDFLRLIEYCRLCKLDENHRSMIKGEFVNTSENRAALHTSLRAFVDSAPKYAEVVQERDRMLSFAQQVREGSWCGCRGDKITDVINIGIGGSDMGPRAVYHALRPVNPDIKVHFLSTVDGVLLERILGVCNPFSTLVVVSSKSFRTRETLVNAEAVDQWLTNHGIVGSDRSRHIVIASANQDAARQMHLPEENLFHFWEWVGGRFSVWSSVGLPLVLSLGPEMFLEFLRGAEEMDQHSLSAPLNGNLPAILAMLAFWNAKQLGIESHCLLPYDERLRMIVPWLQQLEMESLGKSRASDGHIISGKTGQAVWGANGNEGQHSFYQWLREGTGSSSIDLVWSEMQEHAYTEHHRVLLANARAQTEALIMRDCESSCFNSMTTIMLEGVSPRNLGALMSMYEHKTTMLGTMFGLNPFDQPGVELGKCLSRRLERGEDPYYAVKEETNFKFQNGRGGS